MSVYKIYTDLSENHFESVLYLRSRKRWTQELEDQLIEKLKAGESVNMNEFGVTTDSLAAMEKLIDEVVSEHVYVHKLRYAVELIKKTDGAINSLKLHKTASDTYRILINGKVHPLFVGFLTPQNAIKRVELAFSVDENSQITIEQMVEL
jgi:hypothetical protein